MLRDGESEEENLVINGNIYALDWLLYKENSCVVPLLSEVWMKLFSIIQKVEDVTTSEREHRGQKER
jgi:hypothetical protein